MAIRLLNDPIPCLAHVKRIPHAGNVCSVGAHPAPAPYGQNRTTVPDAAPQPATQQCGRALTRAPEPHTRTTDFIDTYGDCPEYVCNV